MTSRIPILAGLALAVSCSWDRGSPVDSGAVYNSAVRAIARKIEAGRSWQPVVLAWVEDGRVPEEVCTMEVLGASFPTLGPDTLKKFAANNRARAQSDLEWNPSSDARIRLLSRSEYVEIFRKDVDIEGNWDRYYARFPESNGLLSFSSVSFGKNQREALVYCVLEGGSRTGGGWLMLFTLTDQGWVLEAERVVRVG